MTSSIRDLLLKDLTPDQRDAVSFSKRRALVVAGAGSGKTEVMARRVAWWVGVDNIPKEKIVAFTFTERAADEMRFRIRKWMEVLTDKDQEVSLGDMYVGTIHGFCLARLREYWPDQYHNYDILDEGARTALVLREFNGLLALQALKAKLQLGQYATADSFLQAYDLLHEHNRFELEMPGRPPPQRLGAEERQWCMEAELRVNVGTTAEAKAFSISAARYYAYLHCRRFLDFSTSQSEFVRRLRDDRKLLAALREDGFNLVVDEVQDINPVQLDLIQLLSQPTGQLMAVGDHRQSIYGFRGARVEIISELWGAFEKAADSAVIDLKANFRSTPRIIELANRWAKTIAEIGQMKTQPMTHGSKSRTDQHATHMALLDFDDRENEARWIAEAIKILIPTEKTGAKHDKRSGGHRGLTLSDIAVLVRSSTDVRSYMQALEAEGITSVVRAGPDLFSQPEILLLVAALAITGGQQEFIGSESNPKSMPKRIDAVLACDPVPKTVLAKAAVLLRKSGLPFDKSTEERLLFAAEAMYQRIVGGRAFSAKEVAAVRTPSFRKFLTSKNELRRVFPQKLFHMLLSEAGVDQWDTGPGRGQAAMFHLGALSGLITAIETPGWTSTTDYPWQIIALCQYGAEEGRTEVQTLLAKPEAITISTIHAAKGLEYAAVFLADVNPCRFPSGFARRVPRLPLDGKIKVQIDVAGLADNKNNDGERRLMYVALTRAERFLFISHSGSRTSKFVKELKDLVPASGGIAASPGEVLDQLKYLPKEYLKSEPLATSFSELRYYLECPHDFYLRKVLGFAPTIDQAFGYGRGVHNLMREIHTNPKKWAALAVSKSKLEKAMQQLIDRGLFYLRYTTGEPAENMRRKGLQAACEYIKMYVSELATLEFDAERPFETFVDYEDQSGGALVSGAIDIIRHDDPPRVTVVDFKSGNPESDNHQVLNEEEMKLQLAIYALGAKKELEYEPEQGLIRYLGAKTGEIVEAKVPLTKDAIEQATSTVSRTAAQIRDREFMRGPIRKLGSGSRCEICDFICFCGMRDAMGHKASKAGTW